MLSVLLALPAAAFAQENDGHFSVEQTARGKALYAEHCLECHGSRLQGVSADPLAGESFMRDWGSGKRTVDDLYYIIRTTMPFGAGNTLEKQQYVDIITYILNVNGYPTGAAELTPDQEVLSEIIIEPHESLETAPH